MNKIRHTYRTNSSVRAGTGNLKLNTGTMILLKMILFFGTILSEQPFINTTEFLCILQQGL